ncbi:MAG: hypothetical protein K0Q67_910 [Cellvibrio sp.]|jgi:hypothetical protein|nr:hypothetical protein [Cellvibrio sp.]
MLDKMPASKDAGIFYRFLKIQIVLFAFVLGYGLQHGIQIIVLAAFGIFY